MAGTGIVARIEADHRSVEALLERATRTGEGQAAELFCELTTELVRHEVAEETVVYPAVRRYVDGGDALADARIAEQAEAEQLLKDMERDGPGSDSFGAQLQQLKKAVLDHAAREEQTVFPALRESIDDEQAVKLGDAYDKAKAAAPTHPHPHAPDTPPGNLVAGPLAAMLDRARDAMHKIAS